MMLAECSPVPQQACRIEARASQSRDIRYSVVNIVYKAKLRKTGEHGAWEVINERTT
jgi:hypothetical protein